MLFTFLPVKIMTYFSLFRSAFVFFFRVFHFGTRKAAADTPHKLFFFFYCLYLSFISLTFISNLFPLTIFCFYLRLPFFSFSYWGFLFLFFLFCARLNSHKMLFQLLYQMAVWWWRPIFERRIRGTLNTINEDNGGRDIDDMSFVVNQNESTMQICQIPLLDFQRILHAGFIFCAVKLFSFWKMLTEERGTLFTWFHTDLKVFFHKLTPSRNLHFFLVAPPLLFAPF